MKKITRRCFLQATGMACAAAALAACGSSSAGSQPPAASATAQQPAAAEYPWPFGKDKQAIEALKKECDQKGTVVELEYDTPAYAINELFGVEETLHKTATVYLPYGYDAAGQYNVLYLLHGTVGENDGPMERFWLEQWGKYTLPVLDNMIAQGLCEPVIVVCPNYYSPVEGYEVTDEMMKALSEQRNDSYLHSDTAEDGGTPDNPQNLWPVFFGQELRNAIIPAAEAAFATYAAGDVSEENLIATRDHRAMAGLSRGSMTVTRGGMMTNLDMISYFGNFSGIWAEPDQFKAVLEGEFAQYPVNFWFNGNGRGDFALDNHKAFVEQALAEMGDRFTDGVNYAFVSQKDGAHMYNSWIVDLYDALLVFFR